MSDEYSFEQKERLARRIQKLKKQKYVSAIEDIITKHNPQLDITTNPSGKFMYFQDLRKETYHALEKYVRKILKLRTLSETSDNQYSSEIIKYSEDDDPFSNNSKLKYSNKERNLIKRKIYDKQVNKTNYDDENQQVEINTDSNSIEVGNDHVYEQKTEHKEKIISNNKEKIISNNNVFVKRKTSASEKKLPKKSNLDK